MVVTATGSRTTSPQGSEKPGSHLSASGDYYWKPVWLVGSVSVYVVRDRPRIHRIHKLHLPFSCVHSRKKSELNLFPKKFCSGVAIKENALGSQTLSRTAVWYSKPTCGLSLKDEISVFNRNQRSSSVYSRQGIAFSCESSRAWVGHREHAHSERLGHKKGERLSFAQGDAGTRGWDSTCWLLKKMSKLAPQR